jgi:hypothetical protein
LFVASPATATPPPNEPSQLELQAATGPLILFSGSHASSSIQGISYRDEDIVAFDMETSTYQLYFDGSDVGTTRDLDGFAVLESGSILMTFDQPFRHPDVGNVDDSDVIMFTPSNLGDTTAGSFSWFLDGSDVGLTTDAEDIDALTMTSDGKLTISTSGDMAAGLTKAKGQDLVALENGIFGRESGGSWAVLLDGSDVELQKSSERIRAASATTEPNIIHLSTLGRVKAGDVSATGDDIIACDFPILEPDGTSCSWSLTRSEMVARYLDGLHVGAPSISACTTAPVGALSIDSHAPGQLIDTSEAGLATGSFTLAGQAPSQAAPITVQVAGESELAQVNKTPCGLEWSIEVAVLESGQQSIDVKAGGPDNEEQVTIEVDLVAAASDAALVQPAFGETPQNHDLLREYDPATGILVFDGDITGDVEPGDGLGGDISALAPDGYLRIVESLAFNGTSTEVRTRQAGLTEFVRQIDIDSSAPAGSLDAVTLPSAVPSSSISESTEIDRGASRSQPSIFRDDSRAGVPSNTPQGVPVGPDTELDLFFTFDPGYEFDLDIEWTKPCWICPPVNPEVKRLWVESSLKYTTKLELVHTLGEITTGERDFGPEREFSLGTTSIPTPIGIPIVIKYELETQLFYEVALSAVLQLEYELGFELEVGYEYNSDGSGRDGYADANLIGGAPGIENIDLGLKFEAIAGVEVDFEVLLYGQAGIEIEAKPQLVFEAVGDLVSQEVKWEIKLEIPFGGGLEIEIRLGPINWEREFGEINIATISIILFSGVIEFDGEPADDVIGEGISIVDDELIGQPVQWGKIEGFIPGQTAWVLSTGLISQAVGSPDFFASTALGGAGDPTLSGFVGASTFDAAVYRLTIVPSGSVLSVEFVFASEEYPEYVGSAFNDVMGVFVNGVNCALVPGTNLPVAVNNVNQEFNSAFYVDNSAGAAGYATTMDGLTVPLTCVQAVTPGAEVELKIAVADTSDGIYDSAVALVSGGISSQ